MCTFSFPITTVGHEPQMVESDHYPSSTSYSTDSNHTGSQPICPQTLQQKYAAGVKSSITQADESGLYQPLTG